MSEPNYTELNRAAWNMAASYHARQTLQALLDQFSQPGFSTFDAIAEQLLTEQASVKGKDVAQLACNNGREILSVKNLGAKRCVGFDISDDFIGQAKYLSQQSGIDCQFIRSDIYHIPSEFDRSFDLVISTVGTLGWMPDVNGFIRVARRLLKPDGMLFFYEMHPILDMFDSDTGLQVKHSYFRTAPYVEEGGIDYYGKQSYTSPPLYWFHHTLSDIISSCLESGLSLLFFKEYDHDVSNVFAAFEQFETRPPLSYALIAKNESFGNDRNPSPGEEKKLF